MVARERGCSPREGGSAAPSGGSAAACCAGGGRCRGPSAPSPRAHPRRRSQREDARPAERLRVGRGWSRGALRGGGRRGQPQLLPPRSSVPEEESRAPPLALPPPATHSPRGRILPGSGAEPRGAPEPLRPSGAVLAWSPGRSGLANQYAGFGTSVASWEELGGFSSLRPGRRCRWSPTASPSAAGHSPARGTGAPRGEGRPVPTRCLSPGTGRPARRRRGRTRPRTSLTSSSSYCPAAGMEPQAGAGAGGSECPASSEPPKHRRTPPHPPAVGLPRQEEQMLRGFLCIARWVLSTSRRRRGSSWAAQMLFAARHRFGYRQSRVARGTARTPQGQKGQRAPPRQGSSSAGEDWRISCPASPTCR